MENYSEKIELNNKRNSFIIVPIEDNHEFVVNDTTTDFDICFCDTAEMALIVAQSLDLAYSVYLIDKKLSGEFINMLATCREKFNVKED